MGHVLITGATAGIGEASAKVFAEHKWNLVLTGRRQERLASIKTSLQRTYNIDVQTLCFDVRDSEAVEEALAKVDLTSLDILINNAGLALGKAQLHEGLLEDWEAMIDTNIKGLLYMTRIIAPHFVKKKAGHIINIGSIAGKEVYDRGNVYCATKFAVDALNKALRIELVQHNVKVTSINPGKVETEFSEVRYKGDREKAKDVYSSYPHLQASDIADIILFIATRPAHVNINEILITSTGQADAHYQIS